MSEKGRPSRGCSAKPCVTTTTTTTKGVIDLNDSYGDAVMPCNVNRSNQPTTNNSPKGLLLWQHNSPMSAFSGPTFWQVSSVSSGGGGLDFWSDCWVPLCCLLLCSFCCYWFGELNGLFGYVRPLCRAPICQGGFVAQLWRGGVEFHLSETRFTRVV